MEAEILGCKLVWADENPPAVVSHPLLDGISLDALSVNPIDYIGEPDDSNVEFKSSEGYGGIGNVYKFQKGINNTEDFPGALGSDGKQWPKIIDISFEAEAGMYSLQLHIDGQGSAEFFLDDERILVTNIQKGQFPIFFGVSNPGKHTIRVMTWGKKANIIFDAVGFARIFDKGISQRIEEPAGYWARLFEEISIPTKAGQLIETRRYTMKNDAPWIEMELNRTITGRVENVLTLMSLPGYSSLTVGKTAYNSSTTLKTIPDAILLHDESGSKPDIVLAFMEKGKLEEISFISGKELRLISEQGKAEIIKLGLFISNVLYSSEELLQNYKTIIRPISSSTMLLHEGDKLKVVNKSKMPVMSVIPVAHKGQGPFYVLEKLPKDGI